MESSVHPELGARATLESAAARAPSDEHEARLEGSIGFRPFRLTRARSITVRTPRREKIYNLIFDDAISQQLIGTHKYQRSDIDLTVSVFPL